MRRIILMAALLALPALLLAGRAPEVCTYGALRAMFHEGQTGAVVSLDSILTGDDVYAVGALADLAGEVTVVAGRAYLSYPDGPDSARTEVLTASDAAATLLVAARVADWTRITVNEPIPFDRLDDAVAAVAEGLGLDTGMRIPFLIEGEFHDLQWHVIDGSRLEDGGDSHEDHLAAGVQIKRDRSDATLIGFYSSGDQGVFTHMGSRTHVHCVVDGPVSSGHVDHVSIPAGAVIAFPNTK